MRAAVEAADANVREYWHRWPTAEPRPKRVRFSNDVEMRSIQIDSDDDSRDMFAGLQPAEALRIAGNLIRARNGQPLRE